MQGNSRKIRDPRAGFLQISNDVVRDKTLTPAAFRVMCYVLSNDDNWQVSQVSIGRALEMDPKTVARALEKLVAEQYLRRVPQHSSAGRQADILVFSHERLDDEQWAYELEKLSLGSPTPILPDGKTPYGKMGVHKNTNSEEHHLEEDQEQTPPPPDGGDVLFPDLEPTPKKRKGAPTLADMDAEFDDWWQHVPRKVSKDAARRAYRAARRRGASSEALVHGIQQHAARWKINRTEARFIPHPATWLNGGRWEDDVAEAVPSATPGDGGRNHASDWSDVDLDEDLDAWNFWNRKPQTE